MVRLIPLIALLTFMSEAYANPHAVRGYIDLSDYEFSEEPVILDGEWGFCWSQLVMPGEFGDNCEYVQVPSLWNEYNENSEGPSGFGYASYQITILLPATERDYVLHVEDVYSSLSLYVDGELKFQNGQVATTKEAYEPEWKPDYLLLPNKRDTLDIVLQIANFDHSKGGLNEAMRLGLPEVMYGQERGTIALDLLLTGSLMMGGLFFLGLFFFGHHDKAILFFALFCLTYAYRIIGFGYYVLHMLVDIPWHLAIRLEYITLFLSTYLFCRFLQNLYPELTTGAVWKVLNVVCIVFSCFVLVLPPLFFTKLITPFFVVLIAYLLLTVRVYYLAYMRNLVGAVYILVSSVVLFVVFAYNIFVYFNWLEPMLLATFLGYILFFFSQSLVLSFRFAHTLKVEKIRAEIASQTKSDFLSTISHEIRTPLNAVVGLSHLLLAENPRQDQKESLTSLKYSAEHLTALINDILDYNKLESGSVEFEEMQVDLREIGKRIMSIYAPVAEEKNIYLKSAFDSGISPSLILDATRFAQVMNNLIDNALKFTKEGGVTIRMILVSQDESGQTIRCEVEDTGVGIPKEKNQLIFERFTQASSSTTREFGGSGLGLAIIRKLLELQGATINMESQLGKGSKFFFTQYYKFGEKITVTSKESPSAINIQMEGRKVLLVEDNKINIMVAGKFLKSWGVHYDLAENGLEAVKMTEQNNYDLILMDLQMPEMDGYEASRIIRKKDANIPIIALTASALIREQEGVKQAGMNDFVTKPFDPQELKRKIAKYLD